MIGRAQPWMSKRKFLNQPYNLSFAPFPPTFPGTVITRNLFVLCLQYNGGQHHWRCDQKHQLMYVLSSVWPNQTPECFSHWCGLFGLVWQQSGAAGVKQTIFVHLDGVASQGITFMYNSSTQIAHTVDCHEHLVPAYTNSSSNTKI